MATHSSFLAWEITRTEEPTELQLMGSQELDVTQQLNQTRHRAKHWTVMISFDPMTTPWGRDW